MAITILETTPQVAQTMRATVLFVDLRGYTGLAEQLSPAQVVLLLVEFYGVLMRATESHGGHIFHMAGDGMMAGFGMSAASESGAREGLAAGLAILKHFAPIATRWHSELSIKTGIGIGIHLGDVALGVFGPPGREAKTLVGDTVNVAARLCSRARGGEVLFTDKVAAALDADGAGRRTDRGSIPFLKLAQYELRGRRKPLDIWCVPAPKRLQIVAKPALSPIRRQNAGAVSRAADRSPARQQD
jgi:adenylate cyclase